MPDFGSLFSINANNMKASTIRELLKLTQKPDIISFAGRAPAPMCSPVKTLAQPPTSSSIPRPRRPCSTARQRATTG
ncbi:hypothetical protein MASR2M48_13160 [Spirochaetota bacterium]